MPAPRAARRVNNALLMRTWRGSDVKCSQRRAVKTELLNSSATLVPHSSLAVLFQSLLYPWKYAAAPALHEFEEGQ